MTGLENSWISTQNFKIKYNKEFLNTFSDEDVRTMKGDYVPTNTCK